MFNTMLGFIWKLFLLFFFIQVVTHWSELEGIFLTQQTFSYVIVGRKFTDFMLEASHASFSSLLEVVNFFIFLAKRGTFYIKSKSLYEQYLQQHELQQQN